MSQLLSTQLDAAQLARAVPENVYALFRSMQAIPGCELVESERLSYHHASLPNSMFKCVWRARLASIETDAGISEMEAWYQQRRASNFFWMIDSHTQPADLTQRLLRSGFDGNLTGDPCMAADLYTLNLDFQPTQGFSARQVTNRRMLDEWREVFSESYDAPQFVGQAWVDATLSFGLGSAPWQLYVGYQEGNPVSSSVLFAGAGVAGLYAIGTMPDYRGQGFGAAITLKPLLEARQRGYRYAVLFSSQMGYSVYQRIGFSEVDCRIGFYIKELQGLGSGPEPNPRPLP